MTLATDPATAPTEKSSRVGALRRAAGAGLVAGPLIFLAGLLSSPPGDTTDPRSSIAAFTAHPVQTQVSALLLHYGLIAMALGLLAVPGLVTGRRGRALALGGSMVTAVGMINVSGRLRDDWWRLAAGRSLTLDQATTVVATADGSSLLAVWDVTEVFAFFGVLAVLGALARSGTLGWWWLVAAVAAFAATMLVPGDLQVWPTVAFGAFMTTLIPAGVRLLGDGHRG